MKAVVQRVLWAKVRANGTQISSIAEGLLVLVGFSREDSEEKLRKVSKKIVELRIFEDSEGKMNLSVQDKGFEVLVVPNFTLEGDVEKGRRPSFDNCMSPDNARIFYEKLCALMESSGVKVQRGVFQARMEIELLNYGPVTFVLEL